jgi:probable HAF family extracellular repeat protein
VIGHAFFWADGLMADLQAPVGSTLASAADISAGGQVVGSARMQDGSRHAVLWQPGSGWSDLNDMVPHDRGRRLEFGRAINDDGLIAADGREIDTCVVRAYLLTPKGLGSGARRG